MGDFKIFKSLNLHFYDYLEPDQSLKTMNQSDATSLTAYSSKTQGGKKLKNQSENVRPIKFSNQFIEREFY